MQNSNGEILKVVNEKKTFFGSSCILFVFWLFIKNGISLTFSELGSYILSQFDDLKLEIIAYLIAVVHFSRLIVLHKIKQILDCLDSCFSLVHSNIYFAVTTVILILTLVFWALTLLLSKT